MGSNPVLSAPQLVCVDLEGQRELWRLDTDAFTNVKVCASHARVLVDHPLLEHDGSRHAALRSYDLYSGMEQSRFRLEQSTRCNYPPRWSIYAHDAEHDITYVYLAWPVDNNRLETRVGRLEQAGNHFSLMDFQPPQSAALWDRGVAGASAQYLICPPTLAPCDEEVPRIQAVGFWDGPGHAPRYVLLGEVPEDLGARGFARALVHADALGCSFAITDHGIVYRVRPDSQEPLERQVLDMRPYEQVSPGFAWYDPGTGLLFAGLDTLRARRSRRVERIAVHDPSDGRTLGAVSLPGPSHYLSARSDAPSLNFLVEGDPRVWSFDLARGRSEPVWDAGLNPNSLAFMS